LKVVRMRHASPITLSVAMWIVFVHHVDHRSPRCWLWDFSPTIFIFLHQLNKWFFLSEAWGDRPNEKRNAERKVPSSLKRFLLELCDTRNQGPTGIQGWFTWLAALKQVPFKPRSSFFSQGLYWCPFICFLLAPQCAFGDVC
jgi:hypothetical protein